MNYAGIAKPLYIYPSLNEVFKHYIYINLLFLLVCIILLVYTNKKIDNVKKQLKIYKKFKHISRREIFKKKL
jgi:hypothetical protein